MSKKSHEVVKRSALALANGSRLEYCHSELVSESLQGNHYNEKLKQVQLDMKNF